MESDGKLKKLLKRAYVEYDLPPDFQTAVWTRIRNERNTIQDIGISLARFLTNFLQPKFALCALLIAIISGFSIGAVEGIFEKQKIVQTKYVNSVFAPEFR